jgi:hypothetical protein
MRRLVIPLALVLALALPASALGAAKRYAGDWDGGGTMSFKVKRAHHEKKVVAFSFAAFPLNCEGGAETTTGFINFAIPVHRNKFHTRAVAPPNNPSDPDATVKLAGRLTRGGRGARLTMSIHGKSVALDGGGHDSCGSGQVTGSASRD